MRHDPGVGAEHHPHPGLVRGAEIVALGLGDLAVLAQVVLQRAVLLALGLGIFGVVDIHREPHRRWRCDGEADALGVGQAGMLDGVDPGADRRLDAVGAMGVGGDAQAPLMRLVGDGAKLGFGQLLLAGLGIAREHPAGGADLDHFGAEFALAADLVAEFLDPVGDPFFLLGLFEARRKEGAESQCPPVAPSA